jgi:DNA polymerase-3 subunit epsilon/ATP-dependent DNA helicase DinG
LRVRQASQSAHILIVNHALLLADVATGNRVLPEYDYLIIDEAHHLEAATTNALSFSVNQYDVERLIHELGSPRSGVLGWLLTLVGEVLSPQELEQYSQPVHKATDQAFQFEELMRRFFETLNRFLYELREGREIGTYGHQERILPATRRQPAWGEVEIAWEQVQFTIEPLLDILVTLGQGLTDMLERLPEDGLELLNRFSNLYRRLTEIADHLKAVVFKPSPDQIYWAEIQSNGRTLALHVAPLHIGELMQRFLWHEKSSVILTSATLTAGNEFDYLRSRLYAEDADELALGSPFDYESATLIYIPSDIPEPSDRHGYQRALERSLIQLCREIGGKTLVLFTSYAHLRTTAQAIGPILGEDEILVYEQGEGASPHALLETFRTAEKAVLMGTRAFWEGVDVPGEALSVLVIAKLPFDVPSDPIVAARGETFEDPFNQYQLPEAVLRFRQGFGRLIRSQSDRGVVAILDRRILSKRYGQTFLESLPTCTTEIGPLAHLPRAASRWLNL